mgnify:CR=1 FL=1
MKIVFAVFGSLGDMHPMNALGIELKKRGYEVTFATMDFYREKIETLGFEFRPVRPHLVLPYSQDRTGNAALGVTKIIGREKYSAETAARRLCELTAEKNCKQTRQKPQKSFGRNTARGRLAMLSKKF